MVHLVLSVCKTLQHSNNNDFSSVVYVINKILDWLLSITFWRDYEFILYTDIHQIYQKFHR